MDWREYTDLEFAVDFMLANRMCKALTYMLPERQILLAIYRSRQSPDFTDSDIDFLAEINQHLNDLYSTFDTIREIPDPALSPQGVAERFHSLSRRETEICSLLARRLNASEIASCLFIGRRTVETHVANIFEKLDVRSREQLRWRLGVAPPTGTSQPQ